MGDRLALPVIFRYAVISHPYVRGLMKGRVNIPYDELAKFAKDAEYYYYAFIPVAFFSVLFIAWSTIRVLRKIQDFYSLGPEMRGPEARGSDYPRKPN